MRVGPSNVRGVQQRIGMLVVHQVHEQLAKRFAASDELFYGFVESSAAWNGFQRTLESLDANRCEFARLQQVFDRQDFVAGLRASRKVRLPAGFQCAGALPRAA